MKRKNKILEYYLIALLGIIFLILGFVSGIYLINTISTLEVIIQWRLYGFIFLTILFILNGYRILSRFFKDKIKKD